MSPPGTGQVALKTALQGQPREDKSQHRNPKLQDHRGELDQEEVEETSEGKPEQNQDRAPCHMAKSMLLTGLARVVIATT